MRYKPVRWPFIMLAAAFLLLLPNPGRAQTNSGLRIYGALSNFDCYNDTPDDCDGFEIEIDGIHKEDVTHTWNFSALGSPMITEYGTTAAPYVVVRYHSDTTRVPSGGVTHFGVTLNQVVPAGNILRRWLPHPTINVPNPPPVPYILPTHQSQVTNLNGIDSVHDSITNDTPDGVTILWVLPYGNLVHGRGVDLEELMPTDPIIQNAVPLGGGRDHLQPARLDPGMTWTSDDPPGGDDTDSAILWYEVYEDVVTHVNHGHDTHAPGRLIGRVMDATITTLAPATPRALTLSDQFVYGTQDVTGVVAVAGESPGGGTIVQISSDNPAAIPPATVTVPANQIEATFTIHTLPVAAPTTVNITVSAGNGMMTASFTIKPPDLYLLYLSFASIASGRSVPGTVFLNAPAPTGGTLVQLTSSNPAIVSVPASVTVPAGATSVDFTAQTHTPPVMTTVTLTAAYNGQTKTTTLRVVPVAANVKPVNPPNHHNR